MILDMRNNPGGLVDEARGVADEFLDVGDDLLDAPSRQVVDEVHAHERRRVRLLPDGGARERVQRQRGGARRWLAAGQPPRHLVGAPTFGKGSVQTIFELPGGAGIRLTTMRYYTPSGRSIQAQGIQPDILVESSRVADDGTKVTRERDLEGHLPAEGQAAPKGGTVFRQPGDAKNDKSPFPDTGPRTAAEVPVNPVGSRDFALSIAYQVVRGVLTQKK